MPPQPPHVPSVAVIVLNWNGTDDTIECLRSLMRVDYSRCEIVVVDNGSRESPRDRIAAEFPSVTYLQTARNLGYAGGNNVGIRHALARGHDYVFVLNNDTTVEPDFLTQAVAVAESDPSIGVVGVKILAWDRPGRVWVAYGRVTYRQSLIRLVGYYGRDDGTYDEQCDVEWIPGTAMLFPRRALERVGLFDETFFAYHEDVDWCTLAREQGLRVVFTPRARIRHKGHRSSGGKGYVTPRQYLAGRNMVLFVRKHARWYQALRFLAFQLGTLPFQYLRRRLTGEQHGVILKVRGMLDAWRGRPLPLEELGLR
jgi:GT2 family glycosyltransferase